MSRHQDYEGHEHLPLAYRNRDFLDGPEGRSLRILSEYLYPLSHFRRERVHDTVVFFGSARLMEMGPLGRYYNEARESRTHSAPAQKAIRYSGQSSCHPHRPPRDWPPP